MSAELISAKDTKNFYTVIKLDTNVKNVNLNYVVSEMLRQFSPASLYFDIKNTDVNKVNTVHFTDEIDNDGIKYLPVWEPSENRIHYKGLPDEKYKAVILDTSNHLDFEIDAYTKFTWPLMTVKSTMDTTIQIKVSEDRYERDSKGYAFAYNNEEVINYMAPVKLHTRFEPPSAYSFIQRPILLVIRILTEYQSTDKQVIEIPDNHAWLVTAIHKMGGTVHLQRKRITYSIRKEGVKWFRNMCTELIRYLNTFLDNIRTL